METMKKVIVFGNGQMAEIAHVYLAYDSPFEVAGFTVDGEHVNSREFRGLPLVAFDKIKDLFPPSEYDMFVPIGAKNLNNLRAEKYSQAKDKGYDLISYVSPKAVICPETRIGENCFIFENNVIQPFVTIGNDVILWSGNHVGHHSSIGDHCFVASHVVISGRVNIEPFCYFGVNSTIRDGINIKERCIIGAGALILKDTEEKQIYRGLRSESYHLSSDFGHVA